MSLISQAFIDLNELKLWFNDQSGNSLTLADMQEIIPLRWNYFRENWEFILSTIIGKQSTYPYPDILMSQTDKLSNLIRIQRHKNNNRVNPFSKRSILTDYYCVWEVIDVASIPLTKEETNIVNTKMDRIRRFTKTDFLRIRQSLMDGRDNIFDTIGLSDTDYNSVFERSPAVSLREPKISDINDAQNFQDAILTVDYILANTASIITSNVDPFALARANANNPEIDIVTGRSGQLVRMFYGDNLQSIASRYFGDPERWIEIAIANGLRPPYVDEIGTAVSLSSNGSESQLSIPKLDTFGQPNISKFYVNQVVFLQSDTVKFPDQRTILIVKEVPISGEIVIELNKDSNLDQYKVSENAYVRVFKPNTINSNFLIMLPSPNPVTTQSTKETPFFLASKSEDEKRAGVDLLVDNNADLVINSTGDFQLSYGLANAIQGMQFKMMSEQGQLIRHPNYGLPSVIGLKATDPAAIKGLIITGITDMVAADPRFSRVETINVTIDQGSAIISLVVRLAGSGSLIPISFTINTG